MPQWGRQDATVASRPWDDLETPFLEDSILAGEREAEREPRLAELEAESPFLRPRFEALELDGELGQAGPQFAQENLLTLPPKALKLPSDAALRKKPQAIKTSGPRALERPFSTLGKRDPFAAALGGAVQAMPDTEPAAINRLLDWFGHP